MSAEVAHAAIAVLRSLVGPAMAVVYVSQAAHALGKDLESLEPSDADGLCAELRKLMSGYCSLAMLEDMCEDVHRQMAAAASGSV